MRRALIFIAALMGLGFVGLVVLVCLVFYFSHDIPAQDVSDLALERIVVAEEENASPLILAALKEMHIPEDDSWIKVYLRGELGDNILVQEYLDKNTVSCQLMEQAVERPICVFPESDDNESIPDFKQLWAMGQLLGVKANHARHAGDLSQATASSVLLIRYSNLLLEHADNSGVYVSADMAQRIGLEQVRNLVCCEDLAREDRDRIAKAMKEIGSYHEYLTRVIKADFQRYYFYAFNPALLFEDSPDDAVDPDAGNEQASLLARYIHQPNRTIRQLAQMSREQIEAASLTYAELSRTEYVSREWESANSRLVVFLPNQLGRIITDMIRPGMSTLLERKYQTEGNIAGTRLLVALTHYKTDTGDFPETLQALVPQYMDAIPADPFDGEPVRYSKEKGIIYCVGYDLMDSGGSTEPMIRAGEDMFLPKGITKDEVFYLAGASGIYVG